MKKTAKAMALLTAASMIMSAFTPVYAASTDTDETAAVDWENGEYDFSIAAMYKTDERCEVVDMSKSYCDSGMILAVKEDSKYADTIKSLADCDGLKVAVKEGATSYNVAQSFLDENPDVSYEIVQYKDTVGCVSDLLAGRVDVVVNDLLNQKILSKEYDGTKIVCDPFTHAENAIVVQKGKDDLLAFIN